MAEAIRADQLEPGDVYTQNGAIKRVDKARICTIAQRSVEVEYTNLVTGLTGVVTFKDWLTVMRVRLHQSDGAITALAALDEGDHLGIWRIKGQGFYL